MNLIKGNTVYDEKLITIDKEEYRLWDIFRSKLAAALVKGLKNLPIKNKTKVLYLGASTGTTVSHISDIIGNSGVIFAIESSIRVAERAHRKRCFEKRKYYSNHRRCEKTSLILLYIW